MDARSNSPDPPFPGAHSQVTRKRIDDPPSPPARAPLALPLQASGPSRSEMGWVVRLPVRAEHVEVEKRAVVYEQVYVRRRTNHVVKRVTENVRREELRVDTHGRP